jgi:hypothetical protein
MAAENTPRFQAEAPASRLALELAKVPESPPSAAQETSIDLAEE